MIYKREATYQQELDGLRAASSHEAQPVRLLWVTCDDCGARYFAQPDATSLTGVSGDGLERRWQRQQVEASDVLEFGCPKHEDMFAV